MHKKSKREKKRLLLIIVTIITLLGVLVGSVYHDWQGILKNRRLARELDVNYKNLLEDEEKLNTEIARLSESEGLIDYARENFLLSTEGDIIIKWNKKNTNSEN